jgi:hypothetical protein
MKMEQCSETSAHNIQTPGNYPEENIQQMWINVQRDATLYSLSYFCKLLALRVSGGSSTRHQEHI